MPAASPSTFGIVLKRHRLAAGLTQEGLAERAGVSARGVQDLERGVHAPRAETVRLLADALDLDAENRTALIAASFSGPADDADRSAIPQTLPMPLTALVDRERETAVAGELLRRAGEAKGARLLTLTGPGGVGKTRVALAVAAALRDDFPDGVVWVDLAPLHDPDLVPATVARTLGVREEGDRHVSDALCRFLANRRLLLVLDNVEQVLPAAGLVAQMLAAAPRLAVLTTSRTRLRLRGERELPIEPLAVPEQDDADPSLERLTEIAAVRLFVARAEDVNPDFTLTPASAQATVEICRRLDGLPLALELAAARVKLLPPPAMLARLTPRLPFLVGGPRDAPARQQTLRAAIDWSHDLLSPVEQTLFARLAVFVGGQTLDAIEAVCNGDGALGDDVLNEVESLVGKNLLRQEEGTEGEPRLNFLETISEYARERLLASGETPSLRRTHAEYFLALAEASLLALLGPEQGRWMARLSEEHDNLRAALSWARDQGEGELWLRLAGALWRFWELGFHLGEGRSWLADALAADRGAPASVRSRALNGIANLAYVQGDIAQSVASHEESLALARAAGDEPGISRSLNDLANAVCQRGDYAGAVALYEESLALSRTIGAAWAEACALHNLGLTAEHMDNLERAATLLAEALPHWERLGDEVARARSLDAASLVARRRGDLERALALGEQGLALRRRLGDRRGVAVSLGTMGWTMLERGDPSRAAACFREALHLNLEAGNRSGLAGSLTGMAALALRQGQPAASARLLATVDVLDGAGGAVRTPALQRRHERLAADIAAALDEDAFATAQAAGRALSAEQAVALALTEG